MTHTPDPTPPDRVLAVVRRHPLAIDALLAVLVGAVGLLLATDGHVPRADRAVAVVVAVLVAVPATWRRRRPTTVAVAVAVLAAVAQLVAPGVSAAMLLAVLVVAYSVVAHGPRWAGPLTAVVLAIGSVLPLVRSLGSGGRVTGVAPYVLVIGLLVGACVWLGGALRRAQLRSVAALRERARLLEEGRRRQVRLELLAERSRISREVHDVVGHSLSGIIAQADGGQFAAARDPQRAVEVLAGIATTGREALGDIRGLLGTLRDADPGDDADDTPDGQPGIDDVPGLVEQVRAGGLPVTLEVVGAPRGLSPAAGLAVYRVVQEGLTNVVKHAGTAAPTRVGLDWAADELTVTVTDDGPRGVRPAAVRGGHGLVGMRERAALHGGSLDAGEHPDGGFVVRLRLPVPAHRRGDRGAAVGS